MGQTTEFIRVYLESLIEEHEKDCMCFITDKVKFTFVNRFGSDSKWIRIGKPFFKNGLIQKCISENKIIVSSIEYGVYGEIIKGCIWPRIENGEIKGAYGIILPKNYPLKDSVKIWTETSLESAFVIITWMDKIIYRFNLSTRDVGKKLSIQA
ncbi:MAG: hypothetical protein HPY50_20990 [Firmicutes bacterium]|nr:hypothetical protein [Bacillota bacterium]